MAVLLSWAAGPTLLDRFGEALATLRGVFPRRRLAATYQGFVKALLPRSAELLTRARHTLRRRAEAMAGGHWRCEGWVALAFDGSRFDLPRTAAHEAAYPRGGKKGSGPQLCLHTLWHLGLGLPWAWRVAVGKSGERASLRAMLEETPAGCLLVTDAGLVGYDLLKAIADSGRSFLLRAAGNARLLRELGYERRETAGLVYLWPDAAARRGDPPLALRLIERGRGKRKVYLITSVLEPARLSNADAGRLYRRRWGVEVFYRRLKQTLERRRLRSGAPARAEAELEWLALGAMLLGLLQAKALIAAGRDPHEGSFRGALRALHGAMAAPRGTGFRTDLAEAVKDGYTRTRPKAARAWPHKKKDPRPGPPRIEPATAAQVLAAQRVRDKLRAA